MTQTNDDQIKLNEGIKNKRIVFLSMAIFFFLIILSSLAEPEKKTNNEAKLQNKTPKTLQTPTLDIKAYDFEFYNIETGKKGGSLNPVIKPQYLWVEAKIFIKNTEELEQEYVKSTLENALADLRKQYNADAVNIYLHESKQHAQSNTWIASLDWWPKEHSLAPENANNINNKSSYIGKFNFNLPQKMEEEKILIRFSESKRKSIWNEVIKAEDKARNEADNKYPTAASKIPPNKLSNYDFRKAFTLNDKENEKLSKQYKEQVFKKYDITKEEFSKITEEGFARSWPMPYK